MSNLFSILNEFFSISGMSVEYIRAGFPNTKLVSVGNGIQYLQESNPYMIGKEIAQWLQEI